ncbi:unnamed protein product [Peronospora belbahrii]|uniref:N-alpha-acetyltransferase 25, NatB auxiliary subunit n=1 Tax=Peronospora belbahrii TaxID=622444 RepID=A0ABN8CTR7_9STRA|nr:unnamed protein product [Peronospora belbahrii]
MAQDDPGRLLARYVRPIYEAIDTRQYKTAMKLCLHKRIAHLDIVQVLKAHCLERTGRVEDALEICRRIQDKKPTDETLLHTMNLVFKLAQCEAEMLPTFEHACTVSEPPNEELFQSLFMTYVRHGSMMLQVELGQIPTRMLALAEKMMLKTLRDSSAEYDGQVVQLTVLIMQLQDNHQGALEAFDELVQRHDDMDEQMKKHVAIGRAAEGEGADEEDIELGPMQAIDRLALEATLAKNVANWTRCAVVHRKLLEEYNADDWTFLKDYIAARFNEMMDCTTAELLLLENELMGFMNELQSCPSNERIRGPALALIHISAETLRRLKSGDAAVSQYFTLYLKDGTLVSAPAKANLIQHFSKLSEQSADLLKNKPADDNVDERTRTVGQGNLSKRLLALKALRFMGYYENPDKFSVDDLNHLVKELEEEYEATNWLNIGSAGGQREVQLTDDLLLLATHFLLDIYQRSSGHREYLERAAGLLEYGLEKSAYNFQMKLLLSRVYGYLGAAEAMLNRHVELDVKYVQLDSLSFLVLDKMLELCQYPEAQKLTNKIAALHRSTANDTPEYIARAYRLGVYSKVIDMSLFLHKRMKMSHSLAISRGEVLRFQLLESMTAGPAKLYELVTSPSFDAQISELEGMLVSNGTELSHNQHREVIVDWTSQQQVSTGDYFGQDDAPLVECDRSANANSSLLWLKLRVLVPKVLKSLAEDDCLNLSLLTKEYRAIVAQLHFTDVTGERQLHVKLWEWSTNAIAISAHIVNAANGQSEAGEEDQMDLPRAIVLLQDDFATIVELFRARLVFTTGASSSSCDPMALSPYGVSTLSSLLLDSGLSSLSALALTHRALGKKKSKKSQGLSAAASSLRNLFKHMLESLMELMTYVAKLEFTSHHLSKTLTLPKDIAQEKAYTNMVKSYQVLQMRLVELLGERCASIRAILQK